MQPAESFGTYNIRVTNTFIDIVDSDDEDSDRPAVATMKSAPVRSCSAGMPTSPLPQVSPRSRLLEAVPEERTLHTPEEADAQEAFLSVPPAPVLLGRGHLSDSYAVNFKVKNTFIDVASDDEHDGPLVEKMKSEPVHPTPPSPQGDLSGGLLRHRPARHPSETLPPQEEVDEEQEVDQKAPPATEAAPPPSTCQVIVPLSMRQPEQSQGSILHGSGQCKPCAWFWRPQGCFNCGDCAHCHLCLPGELKKLKKAKHQAARNRGQSGSQQDPQQAVMRTPVMLQSPLPLLTPPAPALWSR